MNAYCGRHRIPAGLNGCPRCLEEAQEHERAAETAAFWNDLVRRAAYLLVSAVLLTIGWNVARRPAPAPAKPDAASHRPAIEAIDEGLEAAPSSAGVGAPADAVRYAASIEAISSAVNRVRVNLGLWSDAPDLQDPDTRGRWEAAQRDFEADLASIRSGLPAAPANAGAAWKVAYDDLKKAAHAAQRVPLARYDQPASSHILESRYRAVENALNNARASLRLTQGGP